MSKVYCLAFLFFAVPSFAQKGLHESVSFTKPPVIDGNIDDWQAEWWLDPDGKFLSNVGNDNENIYLRLKISDDVTQQKIGLFGLSLRLNPSGKRKGKVGLKYPVSKDKSELKKEKTEAVGLETDLAARVRMKKELVSDVEVLELIGLAKQNIVSSRLGLTNGIEAALIAQDDGAYIYEAKIPFKAFRIKKSEVIVLGVEFETGRFVPDSKSQGSPQIDPAYKAAYRSGNVPRPVVYGNNYQYNALASPGYLFLQIKLK